jgi:hypothetical protein
MTRKPVRRAAVALEMAERDHSALRAEIELLLLTRWMRGFGEAILAQVDAMVLAADGRVRSPAAWR